MMEDQVPTLNLQETRAMERLLVESYGIVPLQSVGEWRAQFGVGCQNVVGGRPGRSPLVVLAGRGHNGGGGLVAARHLLNWGAWVQVVCTHPVG